ncbi:MAG: protein disulfide oxidoreductase [Thiotrichales bacterium]
MLTRRPDKSSRRWKILAIELVIFVVLYLGLKAWLQRDLAQGVPPSFVAHNIQGEPVSLESYRGQPVMLHFWASWCRICNFEKGAVEKVSQRWPVVTVAMQSGDRVEVEQFLTEKGLSWNTVVDESGQLAERFGVKGVPATFFLGKDGQIRFKEVGYTTALGMRLRLWALSFM